SVTMNVGILKVKLHLPENQSLKGKRQVVKSIISRVKNRYNVSIAEVDDLDLWQLATLGITCVSNSASHANDTLSQVVSFIARSRFEAELLDYEIEIIPH
ncbi:MAG: DUF503 domain-containing protein, partial [Dehalococcoidia bacterium]